MTDGAIEFRSKAAGLAYIEFALRRPEHFAVMFDAPVAKHTSSDQAEAAEKAFGTLLGFVKACQDNRQLPSGDTLQFALLAWTMVHGIAKLATAKRLPFDSRAGILKFANFVIEESLPIGTETLTKRRKDAKIEKFVPYSKHCYRRVYARACETLEVVLAHRQYFSGSGSQKGGGTILPLWNRTGALS